MAHSYVVSLPIRLLCTFLALVLVPNGVTLGQATDSTDQWRALQQVERGVPESGDHSANVFLLDEPVTVAVPGDLASGHLASSAVRWRVVDDQGGEVVRGDFAGRSKEQIELGKLGIGWYRIEFLDSTGKRVGWTTAAVLARLAVPTPQDSPICIDSATAWFARNDPAKQTHFSRLAALAGVNWIRDRMRWRDIQPERGTFAAQTTYDSSATVQHRFGLKVLQVYHDTPPWAATDNARGRFPGDLRDVYRFGKEMSQRFQGTVQAWEPWNEGNVSDFGGHTIDEICSYQKAAYLGFKSGDSDVTVCWNATTGVPTDRHAQGVITNEASAYFDTYNIHTYDWPHSYERLWGPARKAACGKPLWVTESDRGMDAESSSPTDDFSPENERLKAQFIAQSYATSLFAGANRHFHFILGQYGERETHFGLLRHDLTPRPAYVALAAVGRLMAGARCLGRVVVDSQPDVHIYAYRACPDGQVCDLLVAWTETTAEWPQRGSSVADWRLPAGVSADACYDYLGRPLRDGVPGKLTSSPTFMVLHRGASEKLSLRTMDVPAGRNRVPSPIVLQRLMSRATCKRIEAIPWAWEFEHQLKVDQPTEVPLFVYNFSDREVSGTVAVEQLPNEILSTPSQWNVTLPAMSRKRLPVTFTITSGNLAYSADRWITLRGDFGSSGQSVLAFQLTAANNR